MNNTIEIERMELRSYYLEEIKKKETTMKNERMEFLVSEVNRLTKKKEDLKINNRPLWNWPNEEGRLIKMYVDEIAELKEQNNKEEKKMERIPTELEMMQAVINYVTKEEETEKMEIIKEEAENIRLEEIESQKEYIKREAEASDKESEVWAEEVFENPVFTKKKDNLVYNKKDKVWMEEGAVFRQISQKGFYNEVDRIRKVFSKLSTKEKKKLNVSVEYYFNDRDIFVKLLKSMMKGGYSVTRKDESSITLTKEWYSFGMRANYYHLLQFRQCKDTHQYIIGDIRDRRLLKDHSKRKKYGSRELPITKVSIK